MLPFDVMMIIFALYWTNTLSLYIYSASSLKQQFAGRHVIPNRHIILISDQTVFVLTPLWLAEQQQILIL
jgi:hypothetical protein